MKIRVTDPNHKYFGQELEGAIWYLDIRHTGNSDDLYIATTPDGDIRLLTSQIDEQYYKEQCLQEQLKELGVNIGDKVRIIKGGSGGCKAGWDSKGVHIVTDVDSTGHVTFDNGLADMFRPKLEKVVCE